ncbi:MAG: DUF885 domain-containing protein [Pseudomonadota bacterium]
MLRSSTLALAFLGASFTLAPVVDAQTFDDVIAQYEAFNTAGSPDAAADERGEEVSEWSNVTPEFAAARADEAQDMLSTLRALTSPAPTPEREILRHLLSTQIMMRDSDFARIPMDGDWGFFAEAPYAALSYRINSREKAEAWIARLNDLPRYFAEHTENMRRGIETGWTQHTDPLATSMAQIREIIVEDPTESSLFVPFLSLSASDLSEEEIQAIKTEGTIAVQTALDAYAAVLAFLEDEYVPAARTGPGLVTMAGGQAAYARLVAWHTAGAGYTPEEIHALGLSEVARIRAEMDVAMAEAGWEGSFEAFIAFLRSDPQFYAQTPEELLEKASEMSKRLDAILPRYFGLLPRLPYGVEAVPAAIAPGYTTGRYLSGDAEDGVAGRYWVNTYALDQRPLYELPALSAHEAVPGHHLQIALAQELEDVPKFRTTYFATAFVEGWGLYAEKLAGEAGFYRTPYERFGQLSYEMWRACRLVVDTGLHHYGWSRAQAEACFKENTALAPLNIQTEVTRYIGDPGQATAYKVGELKILELRAKAKEAMGDAFDIREFHDIVLGGGSMPLDALDQRVRKWISSVASEPDTPNAL